MHETLSGVAASLKRDQGAPGAMHGHHVGWICGSSDGLWLVDYPGNPHGELPARSTVSLGEADFNRAADARTEVLIVFERERSDLPIVVGLLAKPVPAEGSRELRLPGVAGPLPEVVVDGDRLIYTANTEIVLRCGKASIHLLSDGSVRIRGTNVLSRASATNRIRGGNVQIN